jgi:MazG family protein
VASAAAQTEAWEATKAVERATRATAEESALDGVPVAFPALTRAVKIQRRAARVGFDWREAAPILDKIEEEIGELRQELDQGAPAARIEDELGDLLFAVANLARRLDLDPEAVLARATRKFERRFRGMETAARAQGVALDQLDPDRLEMLWEGEKEKEKSMVMERSSEIG